jgi:hypothetical protein
MGPTGSIATIFASSLFGWAAADFLVPAVEPRHRLSSIFYQTDQHAVIRRLKPESSGPVTAEGFSAVQIGLDRNGSLHVGFGRTFAPKIATQLRRRLISTPPGQPQNDTGLQETIKVKLDPLLLVHFHGRL